MTTCSVPSCRQLTYGDPSPDYTGSVWFATLCVNHNKSHTIDWFNDKRVAVKDDDKRSITDTTATLYHKHHKPTKRHCTNPGCIFDQGNYIETILKYPGLHRNGLIVKPDPCTGQCGVAETKKSWKYNKHRPRAKKSGRN